MLYHVYIVKYLNTENIKMLGNTKMSENILMLEHIKMGAQGVQGLVGKRCRTDTVGGNTDFPTAAAVSGGGGGGDGRRRAAASVQAKAGVLAGGGMCYHAALPILRANFALWSKDNKKLMRYEF